CSRRRLLPAEAHWGIISPPDESGTRQAVVEPPNQGAGMSESSAAELVVRWQQGDQQAAAELFHRYASRLIGLARTRLSSRLAALFDPEDVVQSAYRSFFVAVREGEFDIQRSGELWHLLVTITVRKFQHQLRRHRAGQRTIDRESGLDSANA